MSLKPWREIAIPHFDVLEGKFQQAEFAADITAVCNGKAIKEYQDAAAFFHRTFITQGMRMLLMQMIQRLNAKGGEPIIQLQTAFGGGKTHTLLAVYHLATRKCPLSDLMGIPSLLDDLGLSDIPQTRVAVLDGHAHAPGQPWKHGEQIIHTLWGETAWQLGGSEAFEFLKESDATGTSPGKNVLKNILEKYAPCVILIDELVAYIRQFSKGKTLSGGTFDSNISFIQALTESCKLVPNVMLFATLPESDVEAGDFGVVALRALEKTFGRVQAIWKPVAAEEAFEIVRRRLFEAISDKKNCEEVCHAFADAYRTEGGKFPTETQESRYLDLLMQAYPIHPEVFNRLYEDWTTIDGFQRTRGILKLMAKVIYRLWKDDNKDLMIMPASLPLYDHDSRNELTCYLPAGWDSVLEKDIDGNRSETTELENKEPRFGAVNAARRVARTIFLGSAPSSVTIKPGVMKVGIRGLNRAHILLGCFQPGQTSSIYTDVLQRLADRLHYLNITGDKSQDALQYWFDIRANLLREMEERKKHFEKNEISNRLAKVLKKLTDKSTFFDGIHIFTEHSDIADDDALRLVILAPHHYYSREEIGPAFDIALKYMENHGDKPRYHCNRLIFLAPDGSAVSRVCEHIRMVMAWNSIVEDVKSKRLVLDNLQAQQAEEKLQRAEEILSHVARECYKWLLCPSQNNPLLPKKNIEALTIPTGGSLIPAIEKVCLENEWVIATWAPVHLKMLLQNIYWKTGKSAISAMTFWQDSLKYIYLPRLKEFSVLAEVIRKGAASQDFFGTASGQHEDKFDEFKFGDGNIQLNDKLLLIDPTIAKKYQESQTPPAMPTQIADLTVSASSYKTTSQDSSEKPPVANSKTHAQVSKLSASPTHAEISSSQPSKYHTFIGNVDVKAATAKMNLVQITDEIIAPLLGDSHAEIKITVEITANFPQGVSDQTKRTISENAASLGFKNKTWE